MEFGNAFDMLVGIIQVVVRWVAEALVPKETFCFLADVVDRWCDPERSRGSRQGNRKLSRPL